MSRSLALPLFRRTGGAVLAALSLLAAGALPARAQAPPTAARASAPAEGARLLELDRRFKVVVRALRGPTVLVRASSAASGGVGYGSGAVVGADGWVLTCAHVIEKADRVEVVLASGRSYLADVRGRNPRQDYALLQLRGARALPVLALGRSGAVRLGDWVVAAGHPGGPYPDLQPAFAVGRVTGLHRRLPVAVFERYYDDAIRTDVPIFPGSSGGPLVDLDGRLIGLNGAILLINENSYAVPIDEIRAHLGALRAGQQIAGRQPSGIPVPFQEMKGKDLTRFISRFMRRAFGKGGLGRFFAGPNGEHTDATRVLDRLGRALGDEDWLDDAVRSMAGGGGDGTDLEQLQRLLEALADPDSHSLIDALRSGDLFGSGRRAVPPGGSATPDPFQQFMEGILRGGQNDGTDLIRKALDALTGPPPEASPEDLLRAVDRLSSRELRELVERTDPAALESMARKLGPERMRALFAKLAPKDRLRLMAGPAGRERLRRLQRLGLLGSVPTPQAKTPSSPAPGARRTPPPARAPQRAAQAPRGSAPASPRPAPPSSARRPYLGLRPDLGSAAADHVRGVIVRSATERGPAAVAGLKAGDVLVALGGRPIERVSDLGPALSRLRPGQTVTAVVLRTDPKSGVPLARRVELRVTLGEWGAR